MGSARRNSVRWAYLAQRVLPLAAVVATAACDVAEVVLAEPDPLVIAEIFVEAGQGPHRATAFVHRILGAGPSAAVPGADVQLTSNGTTLRLTDAEDLSPCLIPDDVEDLEGTCYVLDPMPAGFGLLSASPRNPSALTCSSEFSARGRCCKNGWY